MRKRRRIGIRTKLMLVASVLVVLPLLAYYYVREMRAFLLEGQERALSLTARAIATVLHDRDDVFDPERGLPLPMEETHAMPVHILDEPVRLDGDATDWGPLAAEARTYGREFVLESSGAYRESDVQLRLVLGLQNGYLYALALVRDDAVLYRRPEYLRLDRSDHLRLQIGDVEGHIQRYLITATGPGTGSTYPALDDWAHAATGTPENRIRSEWRTHPLGYLVELRIPEEMLGQDGRLALVVADVDDPDTLRVETLLGTAPRPEVERLNRLLVRSPEIERILAGLDRPGAMVWVVDREQRVRAVRGELEQDEEAAWESLPGARVNTQAASAARDRLVDEALIGEPGVRRLSGGAGPSLLVAAHPIWSGERVVGAVVVEQSESEVLALQRRTIERLMGATLVVFFAMGFLLLAFATRLALRIRRLRDAADASIDRDGRVRQKALTEGVDASDEIGDLARGISDMLARLAQYTRYLELMPRALRHELQNPLNTVSTSLQNLADELPSVRSSGYLAAAERGVVRLGAIVQSLTEAATLEEALQKEDLQVIDLAALVSRYVENCAAAHPTVPVVYEGPADAVPVQAAGIMIEQMLDKLVDNATDFSPQGGEVRVQLTRTNGEAHLRVINEGPPLPEALQGQLFDSLVSGRGPGGDERPHLGMGLYVVRVIAEHHGGRVEAANRDGGAGTVFTVHVPVAPATS